ncbi:MAG TPA: rRNA adenine N-6-methyltransferase family protein, partial [Pirellulales bacterium]|nr:rRNA adenine N-6-methyltransferase family protein [Pirellulales bacterium]
MISDQLARRGISEPRVLSAMSRVPRERFVELGQEDQAYEDRALSIECDQTISQPYIVGLMTQALELKGDEKVLEIGTGSGYQTAILAELAARVVSIERHAELSNKAADVLAELGYENVRLLVGDGSGGWPDEAPYDRI